MSLINQMLRDLEQQKRKNVVNPLEGLHAAPARSVRGVIQKPIWIALLLIALTALAALFWIRGAHHVQLPTVSFSDIKMLFPDIQFTLISTPSPVVQKTESASAVPVKKVPLPVVVPSAVVTAEPVLAPVETQVVVAEVPVAPVAPAPIAADTAAVSLPPAEVPAPAVVKAEISTPVKTVSEPLVQTLPAMKNINWKINKQAMSMKFHLDSKVEYEVVVDEKRKLVTLTFPHTVFRGDKPIILLENEFAEKVEKIQDGDFLQVKTYLKPNVELAAVDYLLDAKSPTLVMSLSRVAAAAAPAPTAALTVYPNTSTPPKAEKPSMLSGLTSGGLNEDLEATYADLLNSDPTNGIFWVVYAAALEKKGKRSAALMAYQRSMMDKKLPNELREYSNQRVTAMDPK